MITLNAWYPGSIDHNTKIPFTGIYRTIFLYRNTGIFNALIPDINGTVNSFGIQRFGAVKVNPHVSNLRYNRRKKNLINAMQFDFYGPCWDADTVPAWVIYIVYNSPGCAT